MTTRSHGRTHSVPNTLALLSILVCGAYLSGCQFDALDDMDPGEEPVSANLAEKLIAPPPGATLVPDQYIVVFDELQVPRGLPVDDVRLVAESTLAKIGAQHKSLPNVFSEALTGFTVGVDSHQLDRLAADPRVLYIEHDYLVELSATQSSPTWGLDRIDSRAGLDSVYQYSNDASGVHVYIIDTGIRATHQDFGGRATQDYSAIPGQSTDGHGHGTHVAGTVGSATWGVAKNVRLHGVKVLDNAGSGYLSQVISGIDWVSANRQDPAVANMSLRSTYSAAVNQAVANSVASGVTYVVAAGNERADACYYSPASEASAITVGATDSSDARGLWPYGYGSNWGSCVDIFAPGTDITSTYNTSDTATALSTGTSMASPHVAGAAAIILHDNPGFTPAQVAARILDNATQGVVGNPGTGSPNLLLRSRRDCDLTVPWWDGSDKTAWFDGANCYVAAPPAGTTAFVSGNNYFTTPLWNGNCPIGSFDGANCYIQPTPANDFIYNNAFYTFPTNGTCPAGSSFDGANCFWFSAPLNTYAFKYQGGWYTTTNPCPEGIYDGANCQVGSAPAGTHAFVWVNLFHYAE